MPVFVRSNVGLGGGAPTNKSQILWPKTSVFGDAREHLGADFLTIMEGEHKIGPTFARQCSMRPRLPLEMPPNAEEGSKNTTRFSRWPLAHAAATKMLID